MSLPNETKLPLRHAKVLDVLFEMCHSSAHEGGKRGAGWCGSCDRAVILLDALYSAEQPKDAPCANPTCDRGYHEPESCDPESVRPEDAPSETLYRRFLCERCGGGKHMDPQHCPVCLGHQYTYEAATVQANAEAYVVAHGDGADLTMHPLDQPCGNCRPPFEITDAMVQRAANTSSTGRQDDPVYQQRIRSILEAALNG